MPQGINHFIRDDARRAEGVDQPAGPYFVLLLLVGYLIKRLIDSGDELHLKPTRRRDG